MLLVYFGSKMIQHANYTYSPKREDKIEAVHLTEEYKKFEEDEIKLGSKTYTCLKVNSLHHQGIEDVSDRIEVIGSSFEFNNVEFFKHMDLPIAGCQSHPEQTYCKLSTALIKELLEWKTKSI